MQNCQTIKRSSGEPPMPSPSQKTTYIQQLSLEDIQKILDDIQPQQQKNQSKSETIFTKNSSNSRQKIQVIQDQVQIEKEKQGEGIEQKEQQGDFVTLRDITVNMGEIVFGESELFPGSIQEIDFSVGIDEKMGYQAETEEDRVVYSDGAYILRIVVKCANQEFQSLDQYVFSVRSINHYDYYEEVRFKIKRGEKADVKVAVKIPALKQNYTIKGFVQIILEDLPGISIPITAKCTVPQINCLKQIFSQAQQTRLIRVPGKKNMPRTPPIPFQNLNPFPLSLEFQTVGMHSFADEPYDIVCQNFLYCQPKSQFLLNMQLKQNINFKGVYPSKCMIRKILVVKVKNSTMVFHYPIQVEVFQGGNSGES